jgi:hypothetical protein
MVPVRKSVTDFFSATLNASPCNFIFPSVSA